MVLLKGIGFTCMSNEEQIFQRCAPHCRGMACTSSRISISKGNRAKQNRRLGKQGFARGRTGMTIYHAAGDAPVSPKKVTMQFLSHVLAAGILAYFLSVTSAAYWSRVGLAALLGAFGILAVSSIYWNWYGFPNAFFLAQGVDMTVGWAMAGGVAAQADSTCTNLITPM
jgi:hypothetical protein